VQHIRSGAAKLFQILELGDVARVDGWLLPPKMSTGAASKGQQRLFGQLDTGSIVFSDINLVRIVVLCLLIFVQIVVLNASICQTNLWTYVLWKNSCSESQCLF
jgi:hypothetical protein